MKKATRLLILTAFVFPLIMASRAYAGGPGPGQRTNYGERERLGLHSISDQHLDPYGLDNRTTDGFHATEPDNNPLDLREPIGGTGPDINRNNLFNRPIVGGHDPYPGAGGRPAWDPANSGGGAAPIDGGISLLLAAGIGLGIRKARARKETV